MGPGHGLGARASLQPSPPSRPEGRGLVCPGIRWLREPSRYLPRQYVGCPVCASEKLAE